MFNPWVRKIPWRRERQPTPVFLPRESHGERSLVGYSLWGHKSWTRLKGPSTQGGKEAAKRTRSPGLSLSCREVDVHEEDLGAP